MAKWSKEHGAAIGSLELNFCLMDGLWLNWRPGGAPWCKVTTVGWEGQGVVCEEPAPSRL
jgi:hypothetical protein